METKDFSFGFFFFHFLKAAFEDSLRDSLRDSLWDSWRNDLIRAIVV